MSIYGSFFGIEDEREWIADLEADGIKAGVIRDGDPAPDDLDAPFIYQGSHVLPEPGDPRGGSVGLASIQAFVRHYRENPDSREEPYLPLEPYLRLDVKQHKDTYGHEDDLGYATVLLTPEQAARLRDALSEWIELTAIYASDSEPKSAEREEKIDG